MKYIISAFLIGFALGVITMMIRAINIVKEK